ncbi:MAG: UPF0179 family protein [Candidatus Thermoplasmatota archaeon]|jgi:uncharacterized protein (UPF0179 family)|nr:UPF0179 family protein [Candidatus Thermoplasmatota archaeon]MCL5789336.1 UPF0179 family protein [Candidatus Thermoplasmatota archaeon]
MIITLVPKNLSKEGSVFQYFSPAQECNVCNLKNVCHNLKPGGYYRVVKFREKEHKCFIHEGDKVYTVEVKEEERSLMIPRKIAKEGAKVTYKRPDCEEYSCKFASICILSYTKDKSKLTVNNVLEGKCPSGFDLVEAKIG